MTTRQPRQPRGRGCRVTDDELRAAVQAGLSNQQIAERFGISRQAVAKRRSLLALGTAASVVAPEESRRFVRRSIDSMEELTRGLQRVRLVQDSCDAWLRDPLDPERYDIGPRADEVDVTYLVRVIGPEGGERTERRRKPLSALLGCLKQIEGEALLAEVERAEFKHADPRELILKTVAECRQTVALAANLARMLADAQIMEQFREFVLIEIAKESPDCARRIADAIRRSLVLCEAFRGPDPLPAGDGA